MNNLRKQDFSYAFDGQQTGKPEKISSSFQGFGLGKKNTCAIKVI